MSRNDICVIETFLKYLSILVTVTGQTSLTNLLSYPYPPSVLKTNWAFSCIRCLCGYSWVVASCKPRNRISDYYYYMKKCPMLKQIAWSAAIFNLLNTMAFASHLSGTSGINKHIHTIPCWDIVSRLSIIFQGRGVVNSLSSCST